MPLLGLRQSVVNDERDEMWSRACVGSGAAQVQDKETW
jgi:hypothetical protein